MEIPHLDADGSGKMFLVPLIKSLAESPEHLPLEWPPLMEPTPLILY